MIGGVKFYRILLPVMGFHQKMPGKLSYSAKIAPNFIKIA
jgi:hypothetical protein